MNTKLKILVIEDDTPVAMMIVNLLTRAKCQVAVAHTGERGIQLAGEGNFDLITMDVDLPDMNGFMVFLQLQEDTRLRETPIVFVSGRHSETDVRHGLGLGAADYITKPFGPADFISRILALAEQAGAIAG